MSFSTKVFPDKISAGSKGGPSYNTRINVYGAGYEQRDILFDFPLHKYDVSYGLKEIEYVYDLVEFFHAVKGRGHSFLFKDYADYKSGPIEATALNSTDTVISTGTSSTTTTYQLKKRYSAGGSILTDRNITRPISTSVVVAINTTDTTAFTISSTSGIITFSAAPATDAVITAGYEFYVPCRFDNDYLPITLELSDIAGAEIMITEDKFYSVTYSS